MRPTSTLNNKFPIFQNQDHGTFFQKFNALWCGKTVSSRNSQLFYLGQMSEPCCISDPQLCQKQLWRSQSISTSFELSLQGWGFSHSNGVILKHVVVKWSDVWGHFVLIWCVISTTRCGVYICTTTVQNIRLLVYRYERHTVCIHKKNCSLEQSPIQISETLD